jgi:hypothetical protein
MEMNWFDKPYPTIKIRSSFPKARGHRALQIVQQGKLEVKARASSNSVDE